MTYEIGQREAMASEDEGINLPANYLNIPLSALNTGARRKLSLFLDGEGSLVEEEGILNNYEGLGEKVGFEYREIQHFTRQKSPTQELLEQWTDRPDLQPTVGSLWEALTFLTRVDVLTDMIQLISRDCEAYLKRKQMFRRPEKPVQDKTVTQSTIERERNIDETKIMAVDDVQCNTSTTYDAFVSYSPEGPDLEFVKTLIEKLEDEYKLKLFIPHRDDLVGAAQNTITANLIEKRCKRMIIVLSPRFLESEDCDFQLKFAQSLSPGARSKRLIPVMIEHCEMPLILNYITKCDYTKIDLRAWFWRRLATSLKAKLDPVDYSNQNDLLSSINLDTSSGSWSDWSNTNSSSSMSSRTSACSSSGQSSVASSDDCGYISPIANTSSGSASEYEKISNIPKKKVAVRYVRKPVENSTKSSTDKTRPPVPPIPPDRSKKKQHNSSEHKTNV